MAGATEKLRDLNCSTLLKLGRAFAKLRVLQNYGEKVSR